jgi:hypothetical protein
MSNSLEQISSVLADVISKAFETEDYEFSFLEYLNTNGYKRKQVQEFLSSGIFSALTHQVEELDLYIEKKDVMYEKIYDAFNMQRAKQIKFYLNKIIEDAEHYEKSKRPGRKPKTANK